ncbi:MAG: ATPase [Bacteroidetes bacterium 24-39-8]|jgi:ABC-type multidrug transport system ATPase subunit|nr:MAG: ATPase [Bacteroidetes bacterium 24-39-8]HQS54527.1 ABC transporter ATP-binding protein [Sediminibacterium sp.]
MTSVIVNNISKKYKVEKSQVTALNTVSFEVSKGELFGIVGPDGSGKTSLFRVLTTLLLADSGNASIEGYDIVKDYKIIRKKLGYMPGRFSLYQDLTVEENLSFFATIFNTSITENYDLIKDIYQQIEPFKERRAGKLSGGMKQKLALCCALIHKPSVLILDEPTTGVDAVSRKEFWEMLQRLKAQGITILVSTPYMDEASMCDRVALMQNGKILAIDKPDQINQQFSKPLWAVKAASMYSLLKTCKKWEAVESCYSFGEYYHVVMKSNINGEEAIKTYLLQHQFLDIEVHQITANIEDSFMALMNKSHD